MLIGMAATDEHGQRKSMVGLAYVHEQQDHHMAWNEASDIAAATTLMRYVTANPGAS